MTDSRNPVIRPCRSHRKEVLFFPAGLNVASGLHTRLADIPEIASAASRHNVQLFDVRHTRENFPTGKGTKRTGRRLRPVRLVPLPVGKFSLV